MMRMRGGGSERYVPGTCGVLSSIRTFLTKPQRYRQHCKFTPFTRRRVPLPGTTAQSIPPRSHACPTRLAPSEARGENTTKRNEEQRLKPERTSTGDPWNASWPVSLCRCLDSTADSKQRCAHSLDVHHHPVDAIRRLGAHDALSAMPIRHAPPPPLPRAIRAPPLLHFRPPSPMTVPKPPPFHPWPLDPGPSPLIPWNPTFAEL